MLCKLYKDQQTKNIKSNNDKFTCEETTITSSQWNMYLCKLYKDQQTKNIKSSNDKFKKPKQSSYHHPMLFNKKTSALSPMILQSISSIKWLDFY